MANHSNVPIVYPLQLQVQGHQGPLMFGAFMDEVDGVGERGSGDKTVDVETLLEAF